MSRALPLLSAAAAVAVTAAVLPAWADPVAPSGGARDAQGISELEGMLSETVVTTATKSAETGSTAPATSTTLTAEDMRRYGIHSLDEAIDFLSLGAVTANPLNNPDIGARGVMLPNDNGDHFLLLVNGHSVNEPLLGAARFDQGAGIPLEIIDHIEVILGPGSVLYGSSAMLGVINVITKRAKDFHGVHVVGEAEANGSAQLGGGSKLVPAAYRGGAGLGYEFKLFGAPSEVTFMADYYARSGPNFTFGPQPGWTDPFSGQPYQFRADGRNSGTWGGATDDTYYAYAPAGQLRLISGNFELNLHASSYQRQQPYRSNTHPTNDFDNPGYDLTRSAWFDLKHRAPLSAIVQLTTRVYGDTFDDQGYVNTSEAEACHYHDVHTCQFHLLGASRWAGLELQTSFDWLKDASLVTLVGVDGRARLVQAKSDTNVLTAGPEYRVGQHLAPSFGVIDATDELLGAYLQQEWRPWRRLGLNGGIRLDSENRYKAVASPRLAASLETWQGGTLKAIYAEAFRSPSWLETNYVGPTVERAQGLAPEHVRSVEGSIEQRIGAQRLLFGVFRSWWSDLVEAHILTKQEVDEAAASGLINTFLGSNFAQYRNVSSIDNYGFNASLSGTAGARAFRYALNVTGAVAHRQDPELGSVPIFVSPEFFGNARASYDLPGLLPTLAVAGRFMGKRLADRAYEGDFTPLPYAPPQFELRGTITGFVPGVAGLSYRLFGNYAFAATAPYVVGPGYQTGAGPAELVPVNQLRLGIGLQYDFLR